MVELLSTYSVGTIIVILFLVMVAVKEVFEVIDFFKAKAKKKIDKDQSQVDDKKDIIAKLDNLQVSVDHITDRQRDIEAKMEEQETLLAMLMDSDKDQIKHAIVKEYHNSIQKGWIDDFTMDSIEKNFQHYTDEGGNSYVHDLMNELRQLPHSPKEMK